MDNVDEKDLRSKILYVSMANHARLRAASLRLGLNLREAADAAVELYLSEVEIETKLGSSR